MSDVDMLQDSNDRDLLQYNMFLQKQKKIKRLSVSTS